MRLRERRRRPVRSTNPSTRNFAAMSTTSETLQLAVKYHQTGQFEQAEKLYRTVLESEPNNPDAHHLLGLAALAVGQAQVAVEHIRTAVDLAPAPAEFHHHLG